MLNSTMFILLLIIMLLLMIATMGFKIIKQSTVALVERLGVYNRTEEAGLIFIMPFIEKIRIVDMKERQLKTKFIPVINPDKKTFCVEINFLYQVKDPFKAEYETANIVNYIQEQGLIDLNEVIKNISSNETNISNTDISKNLHKILEKNLHKRGFKINQIGITDIKAI